MNLAQHVLKDPNAELAKQYGDAFKHYLNRSYESLTDTNLADLYMRVAFGQSFTEREFKQYARKVKVLSGGRINHEQALESLAKALGYCSYGSVRFLNRDGVFLNTRFHTF